MQSSADTRDAAMRGDLEDLKKLHEGGCPWNETAAIEAARNNHLECLRYALENGCGWHAYVNKKAVGECRDYLVEKGYLSASKK